MLELLAASSDLLFWYIPTACSMRSSVQGIVHAWNVVLRRVGATLLVPVGLEVYVPTWFCAGCRPGLALAAGLLVPVKGQFTHRYVSGLSPD